jgi:hypothetical protein
LSALGLAVGGGLGYAVYALFDSVGWAVLLGLPLFLLIVVLPLLILQGIYLVFESSAWTLVYRDLAAQGGARDLVTSEAGAAIAQPPPGSPI